MLRLTQDGCRSCQLHCCNLALQSPQRRKARQRQRKTGKNLKQKPHVTPAVAAAAEIKKTPQRADREKEGGETTPLEKAASLVRVVRQVGSQTHINSMQLRTLLCRPTAVVGCRFRTGASTTFSIPFSPSLTRFPHVSFTATDILLSSLLPCFTGFTNYSCRTKREDDGAAGAMERVEEEEAVEVEAEAVGPAAGVEAARQEPREVRHLRPSRTQQTNCTTVPLTASGGHFVPLRWNQPTD